MKSIYFMVWALFAGTSGHGVTDGEIDTRSTNKATVHLTEAERMWLNTHPQVRWGVDPDWPPFSSCDRNGQLVGIDADITRKVAERVGLRITAVPAASWTEVFKKAEAGEVDFLSATAKTPERLRKFDFTEPYGAFPVVIITRDDADFFTLVTTLASMTMAAPRDNVITLQLQRDFPTAHFILTNTEEEALKLVAHGKADATVSNLAVATRIIRLGGLTNLKISGVTRYEFPLHFAVRKDAPELTTMLNKGLATVTRDEQERIYAAHLTPDVAKARDWGAWRRRALYTALIGGALIGLVGIWNCCLSRQIRHRKKAEVALCEARDRLERRTRQLDLRVGEVEQLNLELRAANQDLESFTGSVSHDLGAPLRRIRVFAGLLQVEAGQYLKGDAGKMMAAILKESTQMDRLIHDLLEFARIGRAELHKQPVNMVQLVQSVVDDFLPQLRNRVVAWKIGDLGEVHGDPALLRCAVVNLIDNALKYSRRNLETRINVDILPDRSQERETTFHVQDNGCGFDMNEAQNLFTPFQRLHSSKDYEGTGIGLANVQKIIQRHGGRIWFESEPDKGATFYFTLPTPDRQIQSGSSSFAQMIEHGEVGSSNSANGRGACVQLARASDAKG